MNKYGGIITMSSVPTGSSNASSLSNSMGETIDARASPDISGATEWPLSRPDPELRNKYFTARVPDLGALVITDSEDDEAIVIRNPRRTIATSPTQPLKRKRSPQGLNPEPQNPQRTDPKTSTPSLLQKPLIGPQSCKASRLRI